MSTSISIIRRVPGHSTWRTVITTRDGEPRDACALVVRWIAHTGCTTWPLIWQCCSVSSYTGCRRAALNVRIVSAAPPTDELRASSTTCSTLRPSFSQQPNDGLWQPILVSAGCRAVSLSIGGNHDPTFAPSSCANWGLALALRSCQNEEHIHCRRQWATLPDSCVVVAAVRTDHLTDPFTSTQHQQIHCPDRQGHPT